MQRNLKAKLYILGDGPQARVAAQCAKAYKCCIIKSLAEAKKKANLFIALGDNALRKKLFLKAKDQGFKLVNLIHEQAYICKSAVLAAEGIVVLPRAIIHSNASIARGVIINTASIVEHDCKIAEFSHISVAAAMGGGVRVGELCLVGVNATILPNISLASGSTLGAGSVLVRDGSGVLVGNPAKNIPAKA